MHELKLSIFNIKLEATEELNRLKFLEVPEFKSGGGDLAGPKIFSATPLMVHLKCLKTP